MACEQFELFWTSTAPESSVLDHFVPLLQSKSEANDNPTKVKQFDEEEIFGYRTKAIMFADIGNKLMGTIFLIKRTSCKKEGCIQNSYHPSDAYI